MNDFLLPDGRSLAYREWGSGPTLVLIHGWAMSSVVFSELAEILGERYRVLCPDLRGHGFSDPGPDYGLSAFAGDLACWIRGLGLKPFFLGGWSLGGQVALELCRQGLKVEGLVLISSTPCFCSGESWAHGLPQTQVRAMARGLKRDFLKTMGEFFDLQFEGETLGPERRREILRFAVRQGRLPLPETAAGALETLRVEDLRAGLGQIEVPTLVIHGDQDRITPPGAGRHIAESIPGARLRMLPGIGHAPFLSDPSGVSQWMKEFLG